MIITDNISKNYGDFKALDHVNINVRKGSVYGLVGPNGAGKTTLIKVITGVYKQDSGSVQIMGEPIYENNSIKSRIAYISDDLFFFHMYTIRQMMYFYRDTYPNFSMERFEALGNVLKFNVKTRISKLSKGQKKQVAFWLSIACKPEIMILDEPVDGLDPVMRRQIWSILMQDVAERQVTVLVSSHNLRELEDVCDYIGIIHEGRLIMEHDLSELQEELHKVQLAFGDIKQPLVDETLNGSETQSIQVLKEESAGRLKTLIVRGNKEQVKAYLQTLSPLVIEFIPLTLEEVFIYELGGVGYEDVLVNL